MIPNATQERAEKLLELYSAAEALLLKKIASWLKIGKTEDAPLWVQKKLREIDALKREFQGALDQLERASADERIALMWAAHDEGADGLRRELNLPEAQAARSQAVVSLIDDMEGRFSELHRRILRDAQDVYRDVLYQALPMAAMGVETTRQALQRALNAFADRGITGFVDKAGRHWGIAEYAEMATRTGMMNAALAGYTQEALNHGEDLVIISDHADECPLCTPWERKVLSLTGAQRYHPDCQGVLADALTAGLFHPNCLHSMTVYVPGLTDRTGAKERAGISAEADAAGYSNRQQQRYMERTVRKWKRRQAVAMTPEEERYAKAYVDRWQARLRSLTGKGAKLPRKYDREGGRVLLSDAAKQLKPLQISGNRVTMKLSDIQVISHSVGAKSLSDNTVMDLTTGELYYFAKGSKLRNVEVFAGKGVRTPFRKAEKYAKRYGGTPDDWQHVKGFGIIETEDGEIPVEVHWVQCEGIGKHEFFIKRRLDED